MTQPIHVNPYAPSQVFNERPIEPPDSLPRVQTVKVILATLAGVLISGGVFGGIAAVLISLMGTGIAGLLAVVPFGMMMGAMIAGIFSLPITFIVTCVGLATVSVSQGWRLEQTRWFAGVCGFFTGLFSFAMVFGLGPVSLVIGIVPAIFGCFCTILVSGWIVRPRRNKPRAAIESVVTPASKPAPLPTNHDNT